MDSEPNKFGLEALAKLPDAIFGLALVVGVSTALGLYSPRLAWWAFPIASMFGFQVTLLGWRCASYLAIVTGLVPFAVYLAIIAWLQLYPSPESAGRVQLLLAIHITVFLPLAFYVAEQVKRWKVPAPSLAARVYRFLSGNLVLLVSLLLGLGTAVCIYWLPAFLSRTIEPKLARERLVAADRQWDESETVNAVRSYKTFLRQSPDLLSAEFGPELDRLFRRVIEFEVNYGSRPEAIDWIERALYLKRDPYFESEQCRQLWNAVRNDKRVDD